MEVEVTRDTFRELDEFIKGGLVQYMNEKGLSVAAMAVILDSLLKTIDNLKEVLDNEKTID